MEGHILNQQLLLKFGTDEKKEDLYFYNTMKDNF